MCGVFFVVVTFFSGSFLLILSPVCLVYRSVTFPLHVLWPANVLIT
jgi:hypothetical protein